MILHCDEAKVSRGYRFSNSYHYHLRASDGLVASIALILATMTHGRRVVLAAVIGLLIAEGLGMAASQFLSDPKRNLDKR